MLFFQVIYNARFEIFHFFAQTRSNYTNVVTIISFLLLRRGTSESFWFLSDVICSGSSAWTDVVRFCLSLVEALSNDRICVGSLLIVFLSDVTPVRLTVLLPFPFPFEAWKNDREKWKDMKKIVWSNNGLMDKWTKDGWMR